MTATPETPGTGREETAAPVTEVSTAGDGGSDQAGDDRAATSAAAGDGGHRGTEPAVGRGGRGRSGALGLLRETVLVVGIALILSLIIKTFLVQAFYIPSGSMENTLLEGDKVIVSKLTPGPFDLKRGDIVVFKDPGGWLDPTPPTHRSAAVGGAVHDGLDLDRAAAQRRGRSPDQAGHRAPRRSRRVLYGAGVDHGQRRAHHRAVHLPGQCTQPEGTSSITVPPGKVWVMGDHRDISRDSRFNDPSGNGTGRLRADQPGGRPSGPHRLAAPPREAGSACSTSTFAKVPASTASK